MTAWDLEFGVVLCVQIQKMVGLEDDVGELGVRNCGLNS